MRQCHYNQYILIIIIIIIIIVIILSILLLLTLVFKWPIFLQSFYTKLRPQKVSQEEPLKLAGAEHLQAQISSQLSNKQRLYKTGKTFYTVILNGAHCYLKENEDTQITQRVYTAKIFTNMLVNMTLCARQHCLHAA